MWTDLFAVLVVVWLNYPLDCGLWWAWDTFQEGWVRLHTVYRLQFRLLWTCREEWTLLKTGKAISVRLAKVS